MVPSNLGKSGNKWQQYFNPETLKRIIFNKNPQRREGQENCSDLNYRKEMSEGHYINALKPLNKLCDVCHYVFEPILKCHRIDLRAISVLKQLNTLLLDVQYVCHYSLLN